MIRYPGAVWYPTRGKAGHRVWRKTAPLLVLHTRESTSMGGHYPWPPHLTYNPVTGQARQHIDFGRSAYALHHSEPNRRGSRPTFQVELVGYARDTPHQTHSWYEGVADLISWFHANLGVPLVFPKPFGGSETFGEHGSVRVRTVAEWEALSGVVGHQHAPRNRHWDPGYLDATLVAHLLHQTAHRPDVATPPAPHHDIVDHPEGTVTVTIALPVLRHVRPNTKGQHVKNLQSLLNSHGDNLKVDGTFGPGVERAVKAFQSGHGLHADGIVGADTWRHLL